MKAQVRIELKTDAIPWLEGHPTFLVEVMPNDRFGFEFGARYFFNAISFNTVRPTNTIVQISDYFNREKLELFAAAKYYWSKQKKNGGFYTGFTSTFTTVTYLDPNYDLLYREIYQKDSNLGNSKSLFFGVPIGYKWLVKNRLVIEPMISAGGRWNRWFGSWHSRGQIIYQLRVGYRFSKNSEQ